MRSSIGLPSGERIETEQDVATFQHAPVSVVQGTAVDGGGPHDVRVLDDGTLVVVLDAATLAALETTQVGNLPGAAAAVSYGSGAGNQAGVAPADAPGRLMGYAVRETTGVAGASAMVRFRSGATAAGSVLGAGVTLGPNESVREWFGPSGINVPTAVFLERVAGSTEVTVYWAPP